MEVEILFGKDMREARERKSERGRGKRRAKEKWGHGEGRGVRKGGER